jgi:hypothetical protein
MVEVAPRSSFRFPFIDQHSQGKVVDQVAGRNTNHQHGFVPFCPGSGCGEPPHIQKPMWAQKSRDILDSTIHSERTIKFEHSCDEFDEQAIFPKSRFRKGWKAPRNQMCFQLVFLEVQRSERTYAARRHEPKRSRLRQFDPDPESSACTFTFEFSH